MPLNFKEEVGVPGYVGWIVLGVALGMTFYLYYTLIVDSYFRRW